MEALFKERNRCLICHTLSEEVSWKEKALLWDWPDQEMMKYSEEIVHILDCPRCRFSWLKQVPAEKSFYQRLYDVPFDPHHYHHNMGRDGVFRFVLSEISFRMDTKGKKILDIGSSSGRFLKMAQELGLQGTGVEMNQTGVDYCLSELNLSVRQGVFSELRWVSNSFDVITIIDCLEHFEDPMETLSLCHALLKEGGYLLIKVPNYKLQKLKQKILYFLGYNSMRVVNNFHHLNHFNSTSLALALEREKFKDVEIKSAPSDYPPFTGFMAQIRHAVGGLINRIIVHPWFLKSNIESFHLLAIGKK